MTTRKRHYKFQAARESAEPITVEFDDGRLLEFPGDLDAALWLEFVGQWGQVELEKVDGIDQMPVQMSLDLIKMVLGGDPVKVCDQHQLSMKELMLVTTVLYSEYMLLMAGGPQDPKVKAGSESQTS